MEGRSRRAGDGQMVDIVKPLQAASPWVQTVTPFPAPDYDEITHVIQLYIDGLNQADAAKLTECFHENAWWACTTAEDGSLIQHPVADSLDDWTSDSFC